MSIVTFFAATPLTKGSDTMVRTGSIFFLRLSFAAHFELKSKVLTALSLFS